MSDAELNPLLELADGERPLPGDLEERLLTDILATYRQAPTPERGGETSDDDSLNTIVEFSGESRDRRRGTWRTARWALGAAAAMTAVVSVALLVPDKPDEIDVVADPPASTADAIPMPPDLGDLTDGALCAVLDSALASTPLTGAVTLVADIDPDALEEVALAATEVADRLRDGEATHQFDITALDEVSATASVLAIELERGSENAAEAAYGPARTAALESSEARRRFCTPG